MSDANGQARRGRTIDIPTVYGTPRQMAELLASVAQLVDFEPSDTWTDPLVRRAARELAGKLHESLAGTAETDVPEDR